jgi:hypothetical protein
MIINQAKRNWLMYCALGRIDRTRGRLNSEAKTEEKGKSSLSHFLSLVRNNPSNSEHNITRNISCHFGRKSSHLAAALDSDKG